jgi:hypothetical protein
VRIHVPSYHNPTSLYDDDKVVHSMILFFFNFRKLKFLKECHSLRWAVLLLGKMKGWSVWLKKIRLGYEKRVQIRFEQNLFVFQTTTK